MLGTQAFVESHFSKLKDKLGYRRRRAATHLTALGCSDTLWVFRDLRVEPIGRGHSCLAWLVIWLSLLLSLKRAHFTAQFAVNQALAGSRATRSFVG